MDRDGALLDAVVTLLDAFEDVFHRDWDYTKTQLGIRDEETDAQASIAHILGEAPPEAPPRERTFLVPKDPHIEDRNWGNYERLLDAYAAVRRLIPERPGHAG